MEGIAPYKRRTPKPVASPSEALSAAARAGYECAQVPAYTAGTRTDAAHKGEGYGSNRSREGRHPSGSGKWPAERGRRRARASGLARPKGPPAHADDDGRGQKGNFARPRSRPHVLISAEPGAIGRGIPLRTATDSERCGFRGSGPLRKKTPADGGAQVLGRTNSEGRKSSFRQHQCASWREVPRFA